MSPRLIVLVLLGLVGVVVLVGCDEETSMLPKPVAYPRVIYPVRTSEVPFAVQVCPFEFTLPDYIDVVRDTTYFEAAPVHPCWFDLVTPALNGRVHFSYYPVASFADFEKLRDDAFDLAGKHNIVADYIDEVAITRDDADVFGFAFSLEGDVASPFQFYVTDSTQHFLRGSMYVNAKAQADSLAPVYDFMRDDLLEVIESLTWKS